MSRPVLRKLTSVEPAGEALRRLEENVSDVVRQANDSFLAAPDIIGVAVGDVTAKVGQFLPVNPEAGAMRVTLPKPSTAENGKSIHVANVGPSTNVITFVGADCLVAGQPTATISSAYTTAYFVAYGGNWYVF